MADRVNNNRVKRIRTSLSRLKHRNYRLRDTVHQYRRWLFASVGVALLLSGVLGFVAVNAAKPDAVLLGRGPAGVRGVDSVGTTDASVAAEPRRAPAQEGSGGREIESGEASYYGRELEGRPTASGERFESGGLTAAHRTLPMGSRVRVTNVRSGKSVVVRINDRGPFARKRVIDLSEAAARNIGMLGAGTALVRLELLH